MDSFDAEGRAAYRMAMIVAWLIALVVPALATVGGAWLVGHLDPGRATALDERVVMAVQYCLAAAPPVALAVFGLAERALPRAVRASALATGAATLSIWAWYHVGAPLATGRAAGMILLASPIALGALSVVAYVVAARRD